MKAKPMKGTVKWFDTKKKLGFITPDDGAPDIFVHIDDVERAGLSELKEGQKVKFEIETSKTTMKQWAVNISLVTTEAQAEIRPESQRSRLDSRLRPR